MDMWKFFDITHREHILCNPMNLEKLEQLITLLPLKPGARVLVNWYSHSGHFEKSDIENKLFEVRDDNRKKELFKAI